MLFFHKSLGIDISDYSIEVVSLGGSIKNPKLLAMGREILKKEVVKNGKILKEDELERSLRSLIESPKFGKIKTKKFIFSFPESRSFVYTFELSKEIKETKRVEYIKSRAEQTFPYSLKDLYFDFQDQQGEVLLVAAPKTIVDEYLKVFKSCGFQPQALETGSLSLARSLIYNDLREPVLIADIGARTTDFSVFDKIGLRLSISIPIAGSKFTQTLAERLKVSEKKAESLKRKIGLNPAKRKGKFFLILQKEIQEIIWKIREIENYFRQKEGKEIRRIILAGGSAVLPYFPKYLSQNLEKEVTIGDPWIKINIDILKRKEYFKKALQINPFFYAPAIGSALRGLEKNPKTAGINLLRKFSD